MYTKSVSFPTLCAVSPLFSHLFGPLLPLVFLLSGKHTVDMHTTYTTYARTHTHTQNLHNLKDILTMPVLLSLQREPSLLQNRLYDEEKTTEMQ